MVFATCSTSAPYGGSQTSTSAALSNAAVRLATSGSETSMDCYRHEYC
jgi:hypothetical protein